MPPSSMAQGVRYESTSVDRSARRLPHPNFRTETVGLCLRDTHSDLS
jgi:hypothetical protein